MTVEHPSPNEGATQEASWERVSAAFHRASELSPRDRRAWVEAELQDSPLEIEQVLLLLTAADEAGDFLETGIAPEIARVCRTSIVGRVVGPYRLLEEIGQGGMGSVFLAVRDDGNFEQRVAIKLIRHGLHTEEILRRFLVERQILAHLTHPNIARLLDGGSTADGRPYFVLEYIEGRPLTEHCRALGLGVEARLRLFVAVARAVHFAHQRLVVHRDLKPANILVGADGVPKLLDFGIAKVLAPMSSESPSETIVGSRPRTPEYASPEQVEGGVITTASDIYGLGLLLFELLTGRLPERSPVHALPPLASRATRTQCRRLAKRLEGDLDTILSKALATDPAQRYGTANDFAEDIERHLAKEPVRARRPTFAYRMGTFVRRRKLASLAAAALFVLFAVATWQAWALGRERAQVLNQKRRAEEMATFLIDLFKVADPSQNRGATVSARSFLDAAARQLSGETGPSDAPRWLPSRGPRFDSSPSSRADLLDAVGEVYSNLGLYREASAAFHRSLALRRPAVGSNGSRGSRGSRGSEEELARAETLIRLAEVFRAQGDAAGARRELDQVLAIRLRHLGPSALPVARARRKIALVEMTRNDFAAADAELHRAISIERRAGDEGRADLAESLSALAALEIHRERPERAAGWIAQSRAIHQELFGHDHPRSADDLVNLAGLDYRRGDYGAADRHLREGLALRRRLYGDHHPDVAEAWVSLSAISDKRGEPQAAERQARTALGIFESPGLSGHPARPAALNNLAAILAKTKRLDEAEQVYRRAVAAYQEIEGAESSNVANCWNNLAQVRRDRGALGDAEALFRRAREVWGRTLGPEHPTVATASNGLAGTLRLAGRREEAEIEYRRALALRRRVLPVGHPDLAHSLVGLGDFLVERGRAQEGEPLLREALALRRRTLPADHPLLVQAERALAACWGATTPQAVVARR